MSQLEKLHNKCRHVLKKYKGYVVVCMFCDKSIDDIINQAYSLALTELEERLPERTNGYTTETLGFNHCRFLTKRIIKKMKKEIK